MSDKTDERRQAALAAAKMLLDARAVHFNAAEPYKLASGLPSPTYVDCRRLISFPEIRSALMDQLAEAARRAGGAEGVDVVAGGETAGIPFAAFVAERLNLPMAYIRKKPKGYGRNARIEGVIGEGQNVLLIEDLTTDGGSKLSFVDAVREAGGRCAHTAVIFSYGIFPETETVLGDHGVALHSLCTWHEVLEVARAEARFDSATLDAVAEFIADPRAWQAARAEG